jgi:hypothetical protein
MYTNRSRVRSHHSGMASREMSEKRPEAVPAGLSSTLCDHPDIFGDMKSNLRKNIAAPPDTVVALGGLELGRLEQVRTLTSAVTTAWGVEWDEEFIARDLMQNFFDANRDQLDQVRVDVTGADVSVTAPASFSLERLFYLGSEKGEEDVGQYGEGFKVAATCLLRDHAVTPIVASGQDVVLLRLAGQTVGETALRPVEYDFYRSDREIPGTRLILRRCAAKLARAVQAGLTHFFHERNPLLGPHLWSSHDRRFTIYRSADPGGYGHVFYRKLRRGRIVDIPVILVIDKTYESIEKLIRHDRDRNAFGDSLLKVFYRNFVGGMGYWCSDGQAAIVELSKPLWARGHPLLAELADRRRKWPKELTQKFFGDRYYCRSQHAPDSTVRLEHEAVERRWREEGRDELPGYFSHFGVINAANYLSELRRKAAEESRQRHQRPPSTAEAVSIRVLSQITRELAPEVMAVFDRGMLQYTVAETEAVLGELKTGRTYRSREVYLADRVFVTDFAEALAVFLHEHAHIFGYDGQRGFTDALTELLETLIRQRGVLDRYEGEWEDARKEVERERRRKPKSVPEESPERWLATLGEVELRALVARIPQAVLRKLRS